MTANELIDKIEKIQNNKENIDWYVLQFVVPMLRQQQAEIEALKDFAIWMTGCGYDFHQHIYFNEFYDKFLRKEKEHE